MLLLLMICGGMLSVCLAGCKDSIAYPFRRIYTDAGTGGTGTGGHPDTDAGTDLTPISCPTTLVGYATLDGGTTGGGDGPMYTADTLTQLRTYANMQGPAIIRINGTIPLQWDGGQPVELASDKTVVPVQVGDGLIYGGLRIKQQHNVIVRNLTIAKAPNINGADAITIQQSNNVWVDHCDLSSELISPKGTYDGLVDTVHGSRNVTISWNSFHDHYTVSLVGHTDSPSPTDGDEDLSLAVTFHHNFYSHIVEGAPRARFGHVHLFNNLYDTVQMASDASTATYAIASTDGATLLIENNVFDTVTIPIVTILNDSGVTTGTVNDPNNLYGTGASQSANNITTPRNNWKPPYQYAVDSPLDVRPNVGMCAGPGNVP